MSVLAALAACPDLPLAAGDADPDPYRLPPFGNVGLLHFTDSHAQLLPRYFREPDTNIGTGAQAGQLPHLTGEALLRRFGIAPGTRAAHAFSHLEFASAARRYGPVGGFAHLATLIDRLRRQRPGALLLDGGDSWQGSATALWTEGRDMVAVARELRVDAMTGHWEFTLGADRVRKIVDGELGGQVDFLAQNVTTADFGDPVFASHTVRQVNGIDVAVIGQAFPYTPIANPRYKVPDWWFGVDTDRMQALVDDLRRRGVPVVVLLSHNGMDLDLAVARRVAGIDVILGGHTHDAMALPVTVRDPHGGSTLVTNAGCNGKFLGVCDLDVRDGRVAGSRYRLLPVFADLLPAHPDMDALIGRLRAPYAERLGERLCESEGMLYRRGNFTGTFDQVILDALRQVMDSEIALSPGFRWGPALLPGDTITFEHVMDMTALTYPEVVTNVMSGADIKALLEDVADNLFNPDPFMQQGGDMTRVGGLDYRIDPDARIGRRISEMRMAGKPVDASRRYKVATWAQRDEPKQGPPVWDVVSQWLRQKKVLRPIVPEVPHRAA